VAVFPAAAAAPEWHSFSNHSFGSVQTDPKWLEAVLDRFFALLNDSRKYEA
jgi:CelD/BcsL family acetyltransferase involved in cellulose biosynthesis